MGGGDLNLKKSWHPGTLRNQEKVWKKERAADEERKKTEQLLKEKNEERQMLELQALSEAAGKQKKRAERLDWMYSSGAGGNQSMVDEDREAYLLGKKRVDKLIETGKNLDDVSGMDASAVFARNASTAYGITANTIRDTQNKVRDDPLLAIKRREQASLQAVLSNPLKVKEL
ncbi:Pre-mRNA splicing factor-domain-containing protein, partial [Blyttiomyces helicus]